MTNWDINQKIVKAVNRIFHEEEASLYDKKHAEILKEAKQWKSVLDGLNIKNKWVNMRMVDMGTGTGFVPLILSEYVDASNIIICTDISLKMLETARGKLKMLSSKLHFINCDLELLPFKNHSVNVITMNSVLHHLPNYGKALREMDRILKSKGFILIVHEPNRLFFKNNLFLKIYEKSLNISRKIQILIRKRNSELYQNVNKRIVREGLIKEPMGSQKIQQIVDIYSPTAGESIDATKGFIINDLVKEYFVSYNIINYMTYDHLGKISQHLPIGVIGKVLQKSFPDNGATFLVVLQKVD